MSSKNGCWSRKDRNSVLEYLKPNLCRYLFKEALPNLEYHIRSLTGLSDEELHLLKVVHFLLSPAVREFIKELPSLMRNLSHSTQKEVVECRGIIKGRIDWNLTYKEKFCQGYNDPSLFICKPANKVYDLPENQLLKFMLWKIRNLTESINLEIPDDIFVPEKWDSWTEIIISRYFQVKRFSRILHSRDISMPRFIQPKTLQKTKNHRNKSYHKLAACYQLYEDLFLIKKESAIRELIEKQIFEPLNDDKLFEVYVLFKVLEVLDEGRGKLELGLLKPGLNYTACHRGVEKDIYVFYQQVPEKFHENSKNKDIFENYDLNVSLRRPDIILKVEKDGETSYIIIEVKRTDDRNYIVDSVYKVLGYLSDFEECFKEMKSPQGVLAVWDNIKIKKRSEAMKQPVLILRHDNLKLGLHKILGNEIKYPKPQNMDILLEYLPYFKNSENNFYSLISKPGQLPFYDYSEEVMDFYKVLYNENMIRMFNWNKWSGEARRYFDNPELISSADLLTLQKLFTTIIRADRFCEGLIADKIDDKTFLKLLMRLKEIRDELD